MHPQNGQLFHSLISLIRIVETKGIINNGLTATDGWRKIKEKTLACFVRRVRRARNLTNNQHSIEISLFIYLEIYIYVFKIIKFIILRLKGKTWICSVTRIFNIYIYLTHTAKCECDSHAEGSRKRRVKQNLVPSLFRRNYTDKWYFFHLTKLKKIG